jgi:hypothetical protein
VFYREIFIDLGTLPVLCRAVLIAVFIPDLPRRALSGHNLPGHNLLAGLRLGIFNGLFLSLFLSTGFSSEAIAVEVAAGEKQVISVPEILPEAAPEVSPEVSPQVSPERPAAETEPVSQFNASWQTFVSEKGQFSVALPSAPATYTFSPEANTSAMYMQMQLVDPGHLEVYAAAFIESAELTGAAASANETLLSCVSGLSPQPPAAAPRAISLDTALGSYSGIEAEFQAPDGSFQVSRCYLVGDRAYMLTTTRELFSAGGGLVPTEEALAPAAVTQPAAQPVTQPVLERSPTMEAFFSSFKILE